MMSGDEFRGYLYILIGTTLWGVSSVVAKSLFNLGLPPAELILVRLTLSTLLLLVVLLLFDRPRIAISPKDLPYFMILGFVGVAGMQFAYYYSISKIQVGPAILIQYISPVWIALYSFLFQKEPITKGTWAALCLAVLGCYLVMGGYRMDLLRLNRLGVVSGLIASFLFTFYTLAGERGLRRHDPWTILLYGFGFGAILYWILGSPLRILWGGYPFRFWLAFLYIAVFSTLIPFGLYFKGVERIRATRANIVSTWEPVVAGVAAFFILGETLEFLQVMGGFGVIGAVILLQVAKERRAPSPALEIREKGDGGARQKPKEGGGWTSIESRHS